MRTTHKSESKKSIERGKRGKWLKKSKSNCGKHFSHKLMKSVKQSRTKELSSSKAMMVEELIKINLRRVSEKKRKSKQRQIILEQKRMIKSLEIERMNEKIRRMNHKSSRKRKKAHKFRNTLYFRKEKHIKLNLEKYMKNPPKIGGPITKTQRRREMGLEFLNSMETERIKKIVRKDQEKLKKNLRMDGIPKIMISKHDFKRQKGVAEFVKNTRKRVNSPLFFRSEVEKKRSKKRDMMRKLKTMIKKKNQKRQERRNRIQTQAMLNMDLSPKKDLAEDELFERDLLFFNYKHKELCNKYRHIIEKHKKRNKKSSPKTFKQLKTKSIKKKKRKKHKKKKDIPKQIVKKLTPYAEKQVPKESRLKKEKESFSVIKETHTDEEDDSPDILDRFSSSSEDPNQNTIRIHSTEKTDFNPEEERKQKVLNFQENKAATTIQKMFKGWLVRQGIKEWKEYIRAQEEESSDGIYRSSQYSNKEISVLKDMPEAESQTNIFIDDHSNDIVLIEKHGKKEKLASLNLSKAAKVLKDEYVQTSFKNNTKKSLSQDTGKSEKSPIKFQVECIDLDKINIMKKEKQRLEHLAKQEYKKWTQMRNMIQSIENRLGSKAAHEVQELFHQMEDYAENSKKTLKDTFLYNETCLSAQLSEIRVLRNNNEKPPAEQGTSSSMMKDSNNQMVLINNSVKEKIPMLRYINGEDSLSKAKLEAESNKGKLSNPSKINFIKKGQAEDKWVDGNSKNSLTLSPTSSHMNSKHLAGSLNFIKMSGKRSSRELNSDRQLMNPSESDFKNNSLERCKDEERINVVHILGQNEVEAECSTNSLRDRLEELDNHSLEEVNEGAECHYDQDLTSFSRQEEEQSESKEEDKAKEETEKEIQSATESDLNGSVEENLEPEIVLPIKLPSDPKVEEKATVDDTEEGLEEIEEGEEESNINLQNFVENSKVDMAWLISELVENGGDVNHDLPDAENSSELDESKELDKLKSGRVGFLSEAVTDLIISELVEDFSEDPFWNKKLSEEGERLFKEKEESDAETVYGIRTNYNAVNEYCNLLIKFIFDNFGDQILDRLNRDIPMNRPKELQALWERDEKQEDEKTRNHWEEFESEVLEKGIEVEVPHPSEELILSLKVFNVLEDEILSNYQHMNILPELFEMQRIYHRAIFDCLNEALSYPMIINEEGYIRKLVYGKKEYTRILSKEDLMEKLQYCKDIVLEWSSLLCGIIRDKEDSMMGNIRFMEPDVINQLREERLFRFLSLEALEKENTWINYEKEEVRALIDCSDHIFEDIMDELILDLYKIDKKRS